MSPRLTLMVSMLAISAAALGCSAANPSLQPSTDVTTALPTSTPDADPSPLVGCLGPLPDLAAILAIDTGQRLVCFGRSAVTFLAAGVAVEVDCDPAQVEPAWLWCPPAAFLAPPGRADSRSGSDSMAWATRSASTDDRLMVAALGVPMLEVYVAPGTGLDHAQFVPGVIEQVTGHFDDPAAAACRVVAAQTEGPLLTPAEVVLACRNHLVVTSVRPASA